MPVAFAFEHVFRAPSVAAVLASYFDADHLTTEDQLSELGDRVVIGGHDDAATLARQWRVTARRPLPVFVRPFVAGGRLAFVESRTWRRADDVIDVTIVPEVLGGRVQIAARYELRRVGDRQIHRRYAGTIAVQLPLVARRIERAIAAELAARMPATIRCTQDWLDRTANPPAAR